MNNYINKILVFIIYCIVPICIKNMIICIENIGGGHPPPPLKIYWGGVSPPTPPCSCALPNINIDLYILVFIISSLYLIYVFYLS